MEIKPTYLVVLMVRIHTAIGILLFFVRIVAEPNSEGTYMRFYLRYWRSSMAQSYKSSKMLNNFYTKINLRDHYVPKRDMKE